MAYLETVLLFQNVQCPYPGSIDLRFPTARLFRKRHYRHTTCSASLKLHVNDLESETITVTLSVQE